MASFPTDKLVAAIRSVHNDSTDFLPLHAPVFGPSALEYTRECVETGWVSSAGAFVNRFEEDLCKFTGAKRSVAVVNGTAALHVALLMADIKTDDEVLLPAFTFIATGNAVHYCNAIPHFVDIEPNTLGICADKLRDHLNEIAEKRPTGTYNRQTGRRIGALIGMHAFGHPFDLDAVVAVCNEFEIPLVEDAAESIGSYYHDKHTGLFGQLGILSFNGNKTITTGGGGAILTDSEELADRAKHITTTAKKPHAYEYIHDVIGFNYRMPNINAALGCSQLEDLPAILASKRRLAEGYQQAFSKLDCIDFLLEPENCHSNYWLNAVLLKEEFIPERDTILTDLNAGNVLCRPVWHPLHQLEIYSDCPQADLSCTEKIAARVINIPSSPCLEQGEKE